MEPISGKNCLHLSFDLDGTMIDSLPLMKASWESAAKKYGLKVGWSQYKSQIGLPFSTICQNLGLSDMVDELKTEYFTYNFNNVEKIEPMPGLKELLGWLAEDSIEWSIITSKPKETTLQIAERFDLSTEYLLTSDDTKRGKPSNEPAEKLRSMIGSHPNFYYVGDTIVDHIFSINSGFSFVQFKPETEQIYDLSTAGTGEVLNPCPQIKDLSQLRKLF